MDSLSFRGYSELHALIPLNIYINYIISLMILPHNPEMV